MHAVSLFPSTTHSLPTDTEQYKNPRVERGLSMEGNEYQNELLEWKGMNRRVCDNL